MGFNAADAVEPLGWDFTKFGGTAGDTPEPSIDQIGEFWKGYGAYMRAQRDRIQKYTDRLTEIEKIQDASKRQEALAEAEAEYEAMQAGVVEERRKQRAEIFSALCSNQPSYDEIFALPGRILDAYESYLLDEMSPKGSRADTNT